MPKRYLGVKPQTPNWVKHSSQSKKAAPTSRMLGKRKRQERKKATFWSKLSKNGPTKEHNITHPYALMRFVFCGKMQSVHLDKILWKQTTSQNFRCVLFLNACGEFYVPFEWHKNKDDQCPGAI